MAFSKKTGNGKSIPRPGKAAAKAARAVVKKVPGPSANPMTNLIIADLALRTGSLLLRRGVEKGLLGTRLGPDKAKRIIKGRTMMQTLVGTALARTATRSVPGAIVIGGGLVAKTLYDRRRARKAAAQGNADLADQAERGEGD
ncbi:DUF4235 domain-containing protein [Novosphingobium lubricantis]|jgi:hypothetical protein